MSPADELSFALMLALERLSPPERAAFVLHDVFDLSFREIAAMLERSEASCRQLAARARKAVKAERPWSKPSTDDEQRVFQAFLSALQTGDIARIADVLRQDAILLSDGGGRRPRRSTPFAGRTA